ncbi:endonuclease [Flavobacterium terrisoli]|uniref:endonuclease n=1 Tax=Flavobacterium terrisoli TaxID=3242195 RepID=UPI00254301F7|nr:endonuclease [Flavobacterium buctense]
MKKIFTFLFLSIALVGFAQQTESVTTIPPGYYNTATGTGYTLKTQLFNIINDHTDRTYSGLYVTYQTSDIDSYYENNGTMLDMYTENPTSSECEYVYGGGLQDDGTLGNAECERYNREHLVPQSVFGSATPMYSDAHFVVPSDKYVNAQRGDFPFSRVNVANNTYSNGSKRGSNLNSGYSAGYTGTVFEPINEFKGDIARMLLYFATRYEDLVAGWSYPMFNGTSNQVFTSQAINVLLTWNNNDPVSQREIDRNNAIYARQNNRNPYIDHPEYAMQIWGSLLANEGFETLNTVSIYPNPSNDVVNIESPVALDEIEIMTINGQVLQQIKRPTLENNTYTLSNLPKGFYFIKLSSNNNSVTKKVLIN